jgi:tRNA wybutosine-synthesizing protein 3
MASLAQAQIVLSAALQAGFRESGAINLVSSSKEQATPMVAVRSMGLALESLLGYSLNGQEFCSLSPRELKNLLEISNERFGENEKRIARFRELLKKLSNEEPGEGKRKGQEGEEWEDAAVRRERKKAEGLARSQQLAKSTESRQDTEELLDLGLIT